MSFKINDEILLSTKNLIIKKPADPINVDGEK